jgi:hypothetical protein
LRSWTPTSIGSICGDELKEAETWLADQAGHKPAATPAQAQLILANRRAATRRQRGFGVTGVAVMIALAVLAAFALIQRQTAIQQRETTITRVLAVEAFQGNNAIETDHGRLKCRLRAMRGLKQLRCARVITTGHAFIQNIRRGHYELGAEETVNLRVLTAFNQLVMAI